jgi:hypothetical protein
MQGMPRKLSPRRGDQRVSGCLSKSEGSDWQGLTGTRVRAKECLWQTGRRPESSAS